jgi:4-oxalomesaconate tautomerase
MSQRAIPCLLMRGGTSKGPYINLADLPKRAVDRRRVLLRIMGSPDVRQIDGLGGAEFLTSKLAMVGVSERAGHDVDYLFAQVAIDAPIVDRCRSVRPRDRPRTRGRSRNHRRRL